MFYKDLLLYFNPLILLNVSYIYFANCISFIISLEMCMYSLTLKDIINEMYLRGTGNQEKQDSQAFMYPRYICITVSLKSSQIFSI